MNVKRRVGIMGGTFSPIHMVHLILAENAYQQYDLDEVIFLPNGDPPHKTDMEVTPANIRLDMLKLAVCDIPYFRIDDMELRRTGLSYTSVTLQELNEAHPDTDFYFIMGGDSLFQIETWHEPQTIMDNCIILAAVRENVSPEAFHRQMDYLMEKYHADIRYLDIPDLELSSSQIRERVYEGKSIRFMVPEKVDKYIKSNGIYKHPDIHYTKKIPCNR